MASRDASPSVRSVCVCRSPRTSRSVTTSGSSPRSAASISPRSSRSVGAIHGSPSRAYTSSSVRDATGSPLSASNTPYSDSFSPRRTAIVRVRMLCALDPVKYWSPAPHESGGSTRRSTWSPSPVRTDVFFVPRAITSAASGSSHSAAMNGPDFRAATRMSRSPTVSRIRRSDPAYAHRRHPVTSCSAPTISSAVSSATDSGTRAPACRSSSIPCRMLSCVFSPNPLRSASRSASIAAASPLTEEMCRSSYSRSAFFARVSEW